MRTYKVGISDRDLDYSTALMDYVNNSKELGISMIAFSGVKAVMDYLSVQALDVILMDDLSQCMKSEEGYFISGVRVLPLTEIRLLGNNEDYSAGYIYKYQSVDQISKCIRDFLRVDSSGSTDIVTFTGVYSPLGRSGKTTLAKALAGSGEMGRGLYVSMENYSDRPDALGGDLLYMLKAGQKNLGEIIAGQIGLENGIHTLYLSATYMDSNDVSFEEFEMLKADLIRDRKYMNIVFDIGSAAIRDMRILTLYDRLYMPVLFDPVSERKIELFKQLLKETGLGGLISRCVPVNVFEGGKRDGDRGEGEAEKSSYGAY